MRSQYFVVSEDGKAVQDPETRAWLDLEEALELVWQRYQERKKEQKPK